MQHSAVLRWTFLICICIGFSHDVHAFRGRDTCLHIDGPGFLLEERSIVQGLPTPLLSPGDACIETGHPAADGRTVLVDVDNPRVWTGWQPGIANTRWAGPRPRVLVSQLDGSSGWRCDNCDLQIDALGGDGPSTHRQPGFSDGMSGHSQSIAEKQLPWTTTAGTWTGTGASVSLLTLGLRVGHAPLSFRLTVTQPDGTTLQPLGPRWSMVLDPDVLLVPVQVFVLYSNSEESISRWDQWRQLALFDRLPMADIDLRFDDQGRRSFVDDRPTIIHDGHFGEITSVSHLMNNWGNAGEAGPGSAKASGYMLPDDVWARCGVQFRLVNYTEVATDEDHTNPPNTILDLQAPLSRDYAELIRPHPNYIPGIPTAVFVNWCTPRDVAQPGEFTPPIGISLLDEQLACTSTRFSWPNVPAHELGHVILQSSAHSSCQGPTADNVMCAAEGGASVTDGQCATVRNTILGKSQWTQFFEQRHVRAPIAGSSKGNFLQSDFGIRGNFEFLLAQGLSVAHIVRANDTPGLPWVTVNHFSPPSPPHSLGPTVISVSALQSNFSADGVHGNLEVIARFQPALTELSPFLSFFYFDSRTLKWNGPFPMQADNQAMDGVTGSPAFIQSTYGRKGHFELLAPHGGAIRHYERDNDSTSFPWHLVGEFGAPPNPIMAGPTPISVTMIQSNFRGDGVHGDLEAVVRYRPVSVANPDPTDFLAFFYFDSRTRKWHGLPAPIEAHGKPINGVTGDPAIIQSTWGQQGDFELLVPRGDGIDYFKRQNDLPDKPWHLVDRIGYRVAPGQLGPHPAGVSFIQSNYLGDGRHGNFEVLVHTKPASVLGADGVDFFVRNSQTGHWIGPFPVRPDNNNIAGFTGW